MKYSPADYDIFISDWNAFDTAFAKWYGGEDWAEQEAYLVKSLVKRFKLPKARAIEVLKQFNEISSPLSQGWDADCSPVLRALVARELMRK